MWKEYGQTTQVDALKISPVETEMEPEAREGIFSPDPAPESESPWNPHTDTHTYTLNKWNVELKKPPSHLYLEIVAFVHGKLLKLKNRTKTFKAPANPVDD